MGILKDLLVHGSARILGKTYSSGGFVGDLEGEAARVKWGGVSDKPLTYPPSDHDHKNEIVLFDDYLSYKCDKPTYVNNPFDHWIMKQNICTIDDIDIRKGKRLNFYMYNDLNLIYSGILSLNNIDYYAYQIGSGEENFYDYTKNPIYINGKSIYPVNNYTQPTDSNIIYKYIDYRGWDAYALYISGNTFVNNNEISYNIGYAHYNNPSGYPEHLLNQFWDENGEDTEQVIFNVKAKITLTDY